MCVVRQLGAVLSHDSACQGTASLLFPLTSYGLYVSRFWGLSALAYASLAPFVHQQSIILVAILYITPTVQEDPGIDRNRTGSAWEAKGVPKWGT